MKYPDFLSAAKRHSQVCRVLQEKIESCLEHDEDDEKVKHLVMNLYYLSGYIIECSLKYKILETGGLDSNVIVNKIECQKIGLNYHSQIKIHRFNDLQELLDSFISDISYQSDQENIDDLLNNWDPIIRYKSSNHNYQDIKALYNHTNNFLKKM